MNRAAITAPRGPLSALLLVGATALTGCTDSPLEPTSAYDLPTSRTETTEACIAPVADLAAWLPGDGSPEDLALENDGILEGDAGYAAGLVGEAFVFDGVGDRVRVGNDPSLHVSAGAFTVMTWVRFDALTHDPADVKPGIPLGDMSLIDKMDPAGLNADGWRLFKQNDNRFWSCLGGGCAWNAAHTLISRVYATVDTWYHVAITVDETTYAMYVNGVLQGSRPVPDFTDSHLADVLLGASAREGAYLDGALDETQIVARALDAAEIQAVYEAGAAGQCKPAPEPEPEPEPLAPTAVSAGVVPCRGNGNGIVPVALLSGEGLDAMGIMDVRFGATGTEAEEVHGRIHPEDVDGDGVDDAVLHFRVGETGLECGDTEAWLTGTTVDGDSFESAVEIRTQPAKNDAAESQAGGKKKK